MTALAVGDAAPARRYRRVPWSPAAWRQALYLLGATPVLLAAPVLVVAPLTAHRAWPLSLLALALVFLAVPLLTGIQRHRLRATAGMVIPPQPAIPGRLTWPGIVTAARSRATWRQLGYHLLAGPALAVAAITISMVWLAGGLYTLVYAYAWTLPVGSLLQRGQAHPPSWHLLWMLRVPSDLYLTGCGIVLLAAAPWLTAAVGALDARAARALLGPSRAEELQHRVEHLTQTRAGVVDAADAERRRLERNLHDGTQQRLVSLAMQLGMARANPAGAAEAQQVIAEAHEEAKATLAELRNLIRGLHPPVLEDRGLDAALSGVTARMPIPVRLTVDVPRRPPPTVEAVAYFVVSEGLTNITKHAQATQAEVFVQRAADRLHIIVSDDGVGGAAPERGTGLAGLAKRAESVDGTFEIASPPGGPTLLTVDLPCAR
jgi:signal transduction histidine kinase